MEDLIQRLENLIPDKEELKKSEMMKAYAQGVSDAIKTVHQSVASNLYMNGIYYVIMYMNGDPNLPYVEKMRLCSSKHSETRDTYYFTKQISWASESKVDLTLWSKKEITKRVFSSYEQAQKSIMF